ncbi:hypothetical protein [Streptomyces brasiliensis]|uniref:ArsR family transcriptional regulator n=1 Tax=Streptomyces brasiliensis TaxID=1954 RepID=A0A917KYA5_9ACTN|nr:hypothetical protein GCM10010121_053910 [Streptomyces brasiliensis]
MDPAPSASAYGAASASGTTENIGGTQNSRMTLLRDAGLLTTRHYGHQALYGRTPLGIALAAGA